MLLILCNFHKFNSISIHCNHLETMLNTIYYYVHHTFNKIWYNPPQH